MSKTKKATPTGPNAPTADVITRDMRDRAKALLADPDVRAYVKDTWRLHVHDAAPGGGELVSFTDFSSIDLGCVKYLTATYRLLEVIAGEEDAEALSQ